MNNSISRNEITNGTHGIWIHSASNNSFSGNNLIGNEYGVRLEYASDNQIYHNNFISNTYQAYRFQNVSVNFWDEGPLSGGNFWDDYNELDGDGDGIGDTPYTIDSNNTDNYPLTVPPVPVSIFLEKRAYPIEFSSNSTISRFQFKALQKMVSFNVTGPGGTLGFCNLTIPNSLVQDLWQNNFTVLVDGEPIMMNNWTDGTYTYIYFTYLHSEHKVEIIPEFPTWTSMLLILILLIVVIVIYKRRLLKTPVH